MHTSCIGELQLKVRYQHSFRVPRFLPRAIQYEQTKLFLFLTVRMPHILRCTYHRDEILVSINPKQSLHLIVYSTAIFPTERSLTETCS